MFVAACVVDLNEVPLSTERIAPLVQAGKRGSQFTASGTYTKPFLSTEEPTKTQQSGIARVLMACLRDGAGRRCERKGGFAAAPSGAHSRVTPVIPKDVPVSG